MKKKSHTGLSLQRGTSQQTKPFPCLFLLPYERIRETKRFISGPPKCIWISITTKPPMVSLCIIRNPVKAYVKVDLAPPKSGKLKPADLRFWNVNFSWGAHGSLWFSGRQTKTSGPRRHLILTMSCGDELEWINSHAHHYDTGFNRKFRSVSSWENKNRMASLTLKSSNLEPVIASTA